MTGLKIAGALLLTVAGALLGGTRTAELRRRLALLRELSTGLGLMADELTALRTPLPGILTRLRDRPFFMLVSCGFGGEPFPRLWARAAETLDLAPTDREALASLGAVLGRYDAATQTAELTLVRRRLDRSASALEAELAGRANTFAALGASAGAILAVILF